MCDYIAFITLYFANSNKWDFASIIKLELMLMQKLSNTTRVWFPLQSGSDWTTDCKDLSLLWSLLLCLSGEQQAGVEGGQTSVFLVSSGQCFRTFGEAASSLGFTSTN